MGEPSSSSHCPFIVEDDLFAETSSQFAPVFINEVVDEKLGPTSEESSSHDLLYPLFETNLIKNEESEFGNYFGDLYPEVTLKEDLEMRTQQVVSNPRDEGQTTSDKFNTLESLAPNVSEDVLVESLIHQLKGEISPAEVSRSIKCFVPVIRIQQDYTLKVIVKESRSSLPGKEKLKMTGRISSSLRLKSKSKALRLRQRKSAGKYEYALPITTPMEMVKNKFFCSKCCKQFRTERAFENHQRSFEQDAETKCLRCSNLDLKHPSCLRYHRRHVHGEDDEDYHEDTKPELKKSSRVCEVCNKVFTRTAALVYHRRRSHNLGKSVERKYNCRKCNKSFLLRSHLVTHIKGHQLRIQTGEEEAASDGDSDFAGKRRCPECDICGKVFTRGTGLTYHKRRVHGVGEMIERKFKCNLCEKSYLKKSHLVLHGQKHCGERLFPCSFCTSSFGSSSSRRRHEEKIHCQNTTSSNGLSTEDIQQNGTQALTLKHEHASDSITRSLGKRRDKSESSQSYPCSHCTKVFPRLSARRVHERRHTGEKPFLCVTCGNTYKSSVALKEHEKTAHTHTLDLLCTICGAAFGRKMSLKYHILSKHIDKKFVCDKEGCGRSFVQRAKLVRHQRIHKLGLYQCSICNRALESKEVLDRHLLIHEMRKMKEAGVEGIVVPRNLGNPKKKPPSKPKRERKTPAPVRKLSCTYCEKRFPYQNELDKHIKAVHLNVREFNCPELGCSKAYISHYKLQNHLRKAHGHIIENNLLADIQCDECGKVVQGIGRLTIHKNSRHSDNLKELKSRVQTGSTSLISGNRRPTRSKGSVELEIPRLPNEVTSERTTTVLANNKVTNELPIISPSKAPTPEVPRTARNSSDVNQSQNAQTIIRQTFVSGQSEPPGPDQFSFVSFTSAYSNALQPPTFPYTSSAQLAIPQFQQQADFAFQNVSNFWQAHQNLPVIRTQKQIIYQAVIPLNQNQSNVVQPVSDEYGSSDYNDLIQISGPNQTDLQQDEGGNFSTGNGSHGSEHEPIEGDDDVEPKRKRGRPRKDGPQPNGTVQPQTRSSLKKPRKPIPKKHLPCPTCDKVFGTKQHLRTHQQSHEKQQRENNESFPCVVCGRTFARPYYLTVHAVIHDPTSRPFKCNQPGCEEAFRAPSEFRKHKAHHAIKTEKKYRCKICKEEKETSRELHAHVIQVHADKMHACKHPGCSFICPTAARLRRHGEQHQDKGERLRPYKCPFCECSYIRGENLQQHLDTSHDGAASAATNPNAVAFTCPICSKEFEFDWKVKSHIRKTHGRKKRSGYRNKPLFHFCEDCDWTFPGPSALRLHLKSHKGNPIPCLKEHCDKKYFYVNTLQNHIRTQHEITDEVEQKLNELKLEFPSEPEPVKEKQAKKSHRKAQRTVLLDDFSDTETAGFLLSTRTERDRQIRKPIVKRRYHSDSDSSLEDCL